MASPQDVDAVLDRRSGRRRWLVAGALVVSAAVVAGLVQRDDPGSGGGQPPSPLFGQVEQLTLGALPAGWARCGGEPSSWPGADRRWWAQTFGPTDRGSCRPLVTVTQAPPGKVRLPDGATNGGIGDQPGRTGAKHWTDEPTGRRGLYTTGSGGLQLLVVEACCGDEVTEEAFLQVANAARDATREDRPARCTSPHSDLGEEPFTVNFFARQQRVLDDDGCPVRGDVVSSRTEPADAHCFAGVTFLAVGTPMGATFDPEGDDPSIRRYVRDLEGALDSPDAEPLPPAEIDAELPATAEDTGFRLGDGELWADEADGEVVYVVDGDAVEAWPRDRRPRGCA